MIAPGSSVPGNRNSPFSTYPWKTTLLCLAALSPGASAQTVITAPPQTPVVPTAVQEYQNNNPMQVFAPAKELPLPSYLQWGQFSALPHLDYQFLYGNGILSAPGRPQNTIVQEISPGILIKMGSHWTVDYTPTINIYSSSSFQNTVNQNALLQWGTPYRDWFFNASQSFAYSSEPTTVTAAQIPQQNYVTLFNASCQINDKMSLDLGLSQNLNYINQEASTNYLQNLSDYKTWSTTDWLNRQFWTRFSFGLGLGLGYNVQEGSPDSIYQQYQARIQWRATDKISFQLSGGLYNQQYLSGGQGPLLLPIFNAAIQYQPFEQTKISIVGERTVSPSYYQSQTSENTGVTVDFNQRLLGKLFLDLNGSYNVTEYHAAIAGLSTSRNDDTYTFNARLNCPFLRRATASIFYEYSENSSTQSGFASSSSAFAYTTHQVGFELSYRY